MPKNKMQDLRNMLFETMERLLDDDDQSMDLEKAETISKVAQVVVNSAKVEVDFIKTTGAGGSSFLQESVATAETKQINPIPPRPAIAITPETEQHDLCLNCNLPECNDTSPDCLIQIQKRAA
jgi:hypothetical protein